MQVAALRVAGDRGRFAFGDTGRLGLLVKSRLNQLIVGAAAYERAGRPDLIRPS